MKEQATVGYGALHSAGLMNCLRFGYPNMVLAVLGVKQDRSGARTTLTFTICSAR
jgi:hypothetical protein